MATISLLRTEKSCASQERLSKTEINDQWSAQISSSLQSQPACSSDKRRNTSYCPEGNSICKATRENVSHQTKQWTTLDNRHHTAPLQMFNVQVLLLSNALECLKTQLKIFFVSVFMLELSYTLCCMLLNVIFCYFNLF